MSNRVCNKCKQCPPHGDDSWCLGCTGVEALSTELAGQWQVPALRNIAHDWVLSAVRGVKSLRRLSSSLQSAEASRAAQSRGASVRPVQPARSTEDRYRHLPPPPVPPVKEQPESSEEEYETEEEEPIGNLVEGITVLPYVQLNLTIHLQAIHEIQLLDRV